MPWNATCPMEERENFFKDWLSGDETFVELCRRDGFSRSKGYKWRNRYLREGIAGLVERSRCAHRHPNETPEEVCEAIVELRREHPRWGAVKLLQILANGHPKARWPAPSTAHEILRRANLVNRPKRHRRPGEYTDKLAGYCGPNAVWGADFKGYFLTQNHRLCVPLTISDLCSRYLLRCDALSRGDTALTKRVFHQAFSEYGLPGVIRTDNGGTFSSTSGISELSMWWIKLGIRPERITRGCPTENAIHERIHKTMDDEYATSPQSNLTAQPRLFDRFRKTYNDVRPHGALNMRKPSNIYCRSEHEYPTKQRSPEYADEYRVLRVDPKGCIRVRDKRIFLSRIISKEPVGLRDTDFGTEVWYGPKYLGSQTKRVPCVGDFPNGSLRSCECRPQPGGNRANYLIYW